MSSSTGWPSSTSDGADGIERVQKRIKVERAEATAATVAQHQEEKGEMMDENDMVDVAASSSPSSGAASSMSDSPSHVIAATATAEATTGAPASYTTSANDPKASQPAATSHTTLVQLRALPPHLTALFGPASYYDLFRGRAAASVPLPPTVKLTAQTADVWRKWAEVARRGEVDHAHAHRIKQTRLDNTPS